MLADVNFGATFGLISKYFTSVSANAATAGSLRLAHADTIDWRNNANSGNLALGVNSSDQLTYQGAVIPAGGASFVASITGTANETIASSATGAVTLSLPQPIASTSTPAFAGVTATGGILLGASDSSAGSITMFANGSANVFTIQSPVILHNSTWIMPTTEGAANQVLTVISTGGGTSQLGYSTPLVTAVGNLTDAGTDGITVTGGTGAVVGSGTSFAQHVADSTHNGYLSSTDWSTFNGKGTVTSVSGTTNQINSTGHDARFIVSLGGVSPWLANGSREFIGHWFPNIRYHR